MWRLYNRSVKGGIPMNMIIRELRANTKALIIWSICIVAFVAMGMAKYHGFAAMGEEANAVFEALPAFMQKMLGIGIISLTDIKGYFSIFNMYFVLLLGIHAVMLGATIIAKEARDKTADFLLVKPITRHQMITSKVIASVINLIIINIVLGVTSISFVAANNEGESATMAIIAMMGTLFLIQCIFFSLGLALSSITRSAKKASSISTAVLLIMYFLAMAKDMSDKLDFVKYISPFAYFNARDILFGKGIEWMYVILSLALVIIGLSITYGQYRRKDIL